jgi:flagellar biosynthesis protein FliQ
MSENMVLSVMKDAITTGLMVSAPILLASMAIGLLLSIFQATTQIQEQTLTFVPKLIVIAVIGLLMGSWMMHVIVSFTTRIFTIIANIGH